MKRRSLLWPLVFLLMLVGPLGTAWAGAVVVVAHGNVRKIDAVTVQRIYMGKVIEVDGVPVQPVNLKPGQALRQRFLSDHLQQTEEAYTGYWTVRRYIGKGAPPRELNSTAEVLQYVQSTPGAVAYLDEADVPPSANVVHKK